MNLREYVRIHSQVLLAGKLGVDRSLVSQWLSGKTKVTAERAVQIERATNGAVTRAELRPDIFGPLGGIRDQGAA
jgi:DNA-binding transcriptional regulator YdaS (Cro superfamily)